MSSQIIPVEPFDYVVFGGTGDLAERKLLPALYHRQLAGQLSDPTRIIGASRTAFTDAEYRKFAVDALKEHLKAEEFDEAEVKAFCDRLFYVAGVNGGLFRHKVGASVVAVRRSGGVPTFDALNHYITYAEMIMPGSNYWNVIHGREPGEVLQDHEGNQVMRVLGKNMAWLLKLVAAGKAQAPQREDKVVTNFVR